MDLISSKHRCSVSHFYIDERYVILQLSFVPSVIICIENTQRCYVLCFLVMQLILKSNRDMETYNIFIF